MRSCTSADTSLCPKVLPPLPPSSPDILDGMEGSDVTLPLVEKQLPPALSIWSADTADLFVLLCSFLLTTTSIVLVALIFRAQVNSWDHIPRSLPILQRVISSLAVTITSAVVMVAGKRYVLFKLARGGLRSRRMAVYSNPSIGSLASYYMSHGAEFPLLGLLAFWGLAVVTSLTVNDSLEMGSISTMLNIAVPFGPFPSTSNSSLLVSASEQLDVVTSAVCFGVTGSVGLINVTSTSTTTDQPMGTIYYPPLPYAMRNVGFSFSTTMNGFNITMEQLSSVPSTARNLTCAQSILTPSFVPSFNLWYDGSDNQTLYIIVTSDSNTSILRFSATAIILGGTLSSTGHYTEFALNGTSWPNVMPNDGQWAQDITSLICNATIRPVGTCVGSSLSDFVTDLMDNFGDPYTHWSTVLSMALGAYSSAMWPNIGDRTFVQATWYGISLTSRYGIYILLLHIVMSLVMLVVVVRLRLASRLNADFINSTRLLLDPLKKPELFNASLKTTVDALGDPYMLVREDSEFLVVAKKSTTRERRKRAEMFTLRNPFGRTSK